MIYYTPCMAILWYIFIGWFLLHNNNNNNIKWHVTTSINIPMMMMMMIWMLSLSFVVVVDDELVYEKKNHYSNWKKIFVFLFDSQKKFFLFLFCHSEMDEKYTYRHNDARHNLLFFCVCVCVIFNSHYNGLGEHTYIYKWTSECFLVG